MRIYWMTVVTLLLALSASAQDGGRGPGRGRFPGPNVGFAILDLNGDGILDAVEIEAAPKSLAKLDKNSDGELTSDQLRVSMPKSRGGRGRGQEGGEAANNRVEDTVKTLMAFDTNGDGVLSTEEIQNAVAAIWKLDKNGDGKVTREEATPARSTPKEI